MSAGGESTHTTAALHSPGTPAWLPSWAVVTASRLAHMERVATLLEGWAGAMKLDERERHMWRDAGRWHDALRDAPESLLRAATQDFESPVALLHGPATANLLVADGERRGPLLDAITWHTTGAPEWDRPGKALFMADYLEPGRRFDVEQRAFLARQLPNDFEGVFREVLRLRLEWSIRDGKPLMAPTVELWNRCR